MKKMSQSIICITLLTALCSLAGKAQTINFVYDATGNMVHREIVISGPQDSLGLHSFFDEETQELAEDFTPEKKFDDQLGEVNITIYPNPSGGQFAVQVTNMPEGATTALVLYNIGSNVVYTKRQLSEYTLVDITAEPNGTYIMKIQVGEEVTEWKVIKE